MDPCPTEGPIKLLFVCLPVCLSVCLSVWSSSQERVISFFWFFLARWLIIEIFKNWQFFWNFWKLLSLVFLGNRRKWKLILLLIFQNRIFQILKRGFFIIFTNFFFSEISINTVIIHLNYFPKTILFTFEGWIKLKHVVFACLLFPIKPILKVKFL